MVPEPFLVRVRSLMGKVAGAELLMGKLKGGHYYKSLRYIEWKKDKTRAKSSHFENMCGNKKKKRLFSGGTCYDKSKLYKRK